MAVSVFVNLLSPSESVKITLAPQDSPHKGLYSALITLPAALNSFGSMGICSTHQVEISLSNLIIPGPGGPPCLNISLISVTFDTSHSPMS